MTDHNNPSRLISPVWTGCNPRGMGPEAEAEDAANARLIAAAPDLLEACLEMRWLSTLSYEEACAKMDAAIAKATA